jgi:hypothetical protein
MKESLSQEWDIPVLSVTCTTISLALIWRWCHSHLEDSHIRHDGISDVAT